MQDSHCLQVAALECVRGDRLLFQDLNFRLNGGELLHIEGANGCGKTSLLRILSGLGQPEAGEIFWKGRPVREVRHEFLQDLAYLGHHSGIKGELTPLENLRLVTRLYRTREDVEIEDILSAAGLGAHLEAPTRALSAGQRQRIALSRLLVQQASLWILDEPFTSLDVHGVAWVQSLLERHLQNGGLVVMTSHQKVNTRCPVRTLKLG